MADATKIEWCDSTFNPWVGCTKIAPACDHCYAESWAKRSGMVEWGNAPRRRTSAALWREPLKWQRDAAAFFAAHGRRRRVFCASLADVFDNQVPAEWRDDLWSGIIHATPDLDWLLLTKRPQNIDGMLPAFWDEIKGHVWLGTTVEDQEHADRNIPHLLKHDAAVRFISAEPLLGPIDLTKPVASLAPIHVRLGYTVDPLTGMYRTDRGFRLVATARTIDWVIAGGESGPHARPSHPDWFTGLRDQCAAAGVPFLFKQWGEWGDAEALSSEELEHLDVLGRTAAGVARVGKKAAGRDLGGRRHDGFPAGGPP